MKITHTTFQQYNLPLTSSLVIGKTSINTRCGIIITFYSNTGLKGYGEVAPLPGLHKENLSDASEQLLKYESHFSQISIDSHFLSLDGSISKTLPSNLLPSVRTGVEMAMLDLLLQSYPIPCELPRSIPVSALLVTGEENNSLDVVPLLHEGFSTIKIKVGRQSLENDIKEVTAILTKVQNKALLRLDVNRRWSLEEAIRFCDTINSINIEYIEEPTQDPTDHLHLIRHSPIAIALDETLNETPYDQLDMQCRHAVVLKPGLLGGFEKTAEMIRWAQEHQIMPVISSGFETSLTTRMYLIFSALTRVTQIAHGLDTGKWFREDLLSVPPVIERGKMLLPPLATRPSLRGNLLKPLKPTC